MPLYVPGPLRKARRQVREGRRVFMVVIGETTAAQHGPALHILLRNWSFPYNYCFFLATIGEVSKRKTQEKDKSNNNRCHCTAAEICVLGNKVSAMFVGLARACCAFPFLSVNLPPLVAGG